MSDATLPDLQRALDRRAHAGQPIRFWLRDDDAVTTTPALEHLLQLSGAHGVALTLAVIPAFSDTLLAARVRGVAGVSVAVHGWSHHNHAPATEKKQELGAHRPAEVVLDQLAQGRADLRARHGDQLVDVLVPPWNRIAPGVVAGLGALGFRGLSVFGAEQPDSALPHINTHVDVIDWRGTRGGRPEAALLAEIIARVEQGLDIGVLTHHLVHDAAVWRFLERLFTATAKHPGATWVGLPVLL